jgi:hypothetical protein
MLKCVMRLNTYLVVGALLVLGAGCSTPEKKRDKELSTLRVHLEAALDGTKLIQPVAVLGVPVNIETSPFLSEMDVESAKVVDILGGFALQVQFNRHGMWTLEEYSSTARGRHFAIFSQFGLDNKTARWLAAPLIEQRITNGVLTFIPDATREEGEEIVRGLNNVAAKNKPALE